MPTDASWGWGTRTWTQSDTTIMANWVRSQDEWARDNWLTQTTSNWTQWNQTYTATLATTTQIWNDWYPSTTSTWPRGTGDGSVVTMDTPIRLGQENPHPVRTEDEWAEIQRVQDVAREARETLRSAARAQASNLLALVLTEAQREDLKNRRCFDVVGSSGQLWRVNYGTSGNVHAIGPNDMDIMSVCAHPQLYDGKGYLPTEDVLAAQALHLMHDDTEFLRKANVHRGNRRSDHLAPLLRLVA